MTYEKAMDNIRCALDGGCHQVCNKKHRGDCTDAEIIESVEKLQKLVGKADKYKWHSLLKNPNDLPIYDKVYLCVIEELHNAPFDVNDTKIEYCLLKRHQILNLREFVIKWSEIEPFEEVDE